MCLFDHNLLRLVGRLLAIFIPTDRPKSVRNRCVIKIFSGIFCVVTLLYEFLCGCRGFSYRSESDFFLFLLQKYKYDKQWTDYTFAINNPDYQGYLSDRNRGNTDNTQNVQVVFYIDPTVLPDVKTFDKNFQRNGPSQGWWERSRHGQRNRSPDRTVICVVVIVTLIVVLIGGGIAASMYFSNEKGIIA